jgi:hypothetical protein
MEFIPMVKLKEYQKNPILLSSLKNIYLIEITCIIFHFHQFSFWLFVNVDYFFFAISSTI